MKKKCIVCFQSAKAKCTDCGLSYCNVECQTKDWKENNHQRVCQVLKELKLVGGKRKEREWEGEGEEEEDGEKKQRLIIDLGKIFQDLMKYDKNVAFMVLDEAGPDNALAVLGSNDEYFTRGKEYLERLYNKTLQHRPLHFTWVIDEIGYYPLMEWFVITKRTPQNIEYISKLDLELAAAVTFEIMTHKMDLQHIIVMSDKVFPLSETAKRIIRVRLIDNESIGSAIISFTKRYDMPLSELEYWAMILDGSIKNANEIDFNLTTIPESFYNRRYYRDEKMVRLILQVYDGWKKNEKEFRLLFSFAVSGRSFSSPAKIIADIARGNPGFMLSLVYNLIDKKNDASMAALAIETLFEIKPRTPAVPIVQRIINAHRLWEYIMEFLVEKMTSSRQKAKFTADTFYALYKSNSSKIHETLEKMLDLGLVDIETKEILVLLKPPHVHSSDWNTLIKLIELHVDDLKSAMKSPELEERISRFLLYQSGFERTSQYRVGLAMIKLLNPDWNVLNELIKDPSSFVFKQLLEYDEFQFDQDALAASENVSMMINAYKAGRFDAMTVERYRELVAEYPDNINIRRIAFFKTVFPQLTEQEILYAL